MPRRIRSWRRSAISSTATRRQIRLVAALVGSYAAAHRACHRKRSDLTAPPNPFRFPRTTREDLPRLARLAYDTAAHHCGACRDYHTMWPYLRSLGVSSLGPEFNWDVQFGMALKAAEGRDTVRWMLAGSADAGQLALVGAVADRTPGVRHRVTIVDRCPTPLALCRDHADAVGLDLETAEGDLLDFTRDGAFDVVMIHYTLNFVPMPDRPAFLARVASWLAPRGRLWLACEHDPEHGPTGNSISEHVRSWRVAVIREEVAAGRLDLPEPVDTFVGRIRLRDRTEPPPRQPLAYFENLLEAAGLDVRALVDQPFGEKLALYGDVPPRARCIILAEKR